MAISCCSRLSLSPLILPLLNQAVLYLWLLLKVIVSKTLILLITFTWILVTCLFKCRAWNWAESSSWGFINPRQSWEVAFCCLQMVFLIISRWFCFFHNSLNCWLGLFFTVISKYFPVVLLYSPSYLCVWLFPKNCSSLSFPLLNFILWISGCPSLCLFDFWGCPPKGLVHHPVSAICKLTVCVCSLVSCLDPWWKSRLGLVPGWKPAWTLGKFSECPTSPWFPTGCVSLPFSWPHKRQCQKSLTKIFVCRFSTLQ